MFAVWVIAACACCYDSVIMSELVWVLHQVLCVHADHVFVYSGADSRCDCIPQSHTDHTTNEPYSSNDAVRIATELAECVMNC